MSDKEFIELVKQSDNIPFNIIIPKIKNNKKGNKMNINKRDTLRFREFRINKNNKGTMFYSAEYSGFDSLHTLLSLGQLCDIENTKKEFNFSIHIMQSSGIRDYRNELIYDGDIISIKQNSIKHYLVKQFYDDDYGFGFKLLELNKENTITGWYWCFITNKYETIKILGNIYQTKKYNHLQNEFKEKFERENKNG